MSLDPLSTLTTIEQFLRQEVQAAVAPELRSEIKAAAKIINECVRDLDDIAVRLREECAAMAEFCRKGQSLGLDVKCQGDFFRAEDWPQLSLSAQILKHSQIAEQFSALCTAAAKAAKNDQSGRINQLLSGAVAWQLQWATARLPLQSVFPCANTNK